VSGAIAQLADAGHVEDLGVSLPATLTPGEADRYRSCRDFFSWIDPGPRTSPYEVQARIRQAKVTLLGLDGVGTAVADIGQSKVEVAVGRLGALKRGFLRRGMGARSAIRERHEPASRRHCRVELRISAAGCATRRVR
jgi:hypothetical protein